jgi:Zn-dependent protease with chaperone function
MNEPKAVRYQRLARRAQMTDVVVAVALLGLLAFTPASRRLTEVASAVQAWLPPVFGPALATAAFAALLTLLWAVAAVPAVLCLGLDVERRFDSKDDRPRDLLAPHARLTWLGLAATLALSSIVAVSARLLGPLWWLGAAALSALALVAAARAAAVVLMRVGETRPIRRPSLMSGLREIARRSGVPVSDILEWRVGEGARATALLVGGGRARRVLVSSEFVRDWSDDEIAVVVAHELGHHVHRDEARGLALDAVVLSAGFWMAAQVLARWAPPLGVAGPGDLAALPTVALAAGAVWLAARPLRLAQSRAHERRADRFALEQTREAGAFAAAVRRLSARHLAEEQPSRLIRWFFHRHPPVAERLAMAERFARADLRP